MPSPLHGKTSYAVKAVNIAKEGKFVKTATVAGVVAGSVLGIAVGAGVMMMPQSKNMRKALEKGASDLSKTVSGLRK